MEASRAIDKRFVGLAAVSGVAGGVAMAMWMMIYSAATNNGFWSPLNVCMASFVYRSDAQMMLHDMMMHPGMMSMNEPLVPSHLAVGFLVHMAFSVVVGVSFALILLVVIRVLRLPLLATRIGYAGAAVIGALILYALMMYDHVCEPASSSRVDFSRRHRAGWTWIGSVPTSFSEALQEVATFATSRIANSVRKHTVLDATQLREYAGRARRVRHKSETKAVGG